MNLSSQEGILSFIKYTQGTLDVLLQPVGLAGYACATPADLVVVFLFVVLVVLCGVLAGVFKLSFHTPVQTALYQHSKTLSSDFPMNGRFWGMSGFGVGICHTSLP